VRTRQYVSPLRLSAMLPLLRFSNERGAYVLRFVGETRGPVLRKDRRRRQLEFAWTDRREGAVDPLAASRPMGSVRRIEGSQATAEAPQRRAQRTAATRRRRQHGRQRRPRPHH
jgi:hypothetical protein